MIYTKKELKDYLVADALRFGNCVPGLRDKILHNEAYYIWRYIVHMRNVEYHQGKRGWHRLVFLYHWYKFKHLQFKLHFAIYPNTVGPGFRIYHVGNYTHVGSNVKIGKNCTMVSGVVFGNKTESLGNYKVDVGDNVYFGLDCKILGSVRIGNNVTIGANSVVTKDIPDNAIVGGVPAKILRYKKANNE